MTQKLRIVWLVGVVAALWAMPGASEESHRIGLELVRTPIHSGTIDVALLITNRGDEAVYVPGSTTTSEFRHIVHGYVTETTGDGGYVKFPKEFVFLKPGERVFHWAARGVVLERGINQFRYETTVILDAESDTSGAVVVTDLGVQELEVLFE